MSTITQKQLSQSQVEAFYHDNFVDSQVRNFLALVPKLLPGARVVVDIGGGCGFFAKALSDAAGLAVRVVDTDPASVQVCLAKGVEARVGNALKPERRGDEEVICFNLILHHLVGATDADTRALQEQAIAVWREHAKAIFINEYIYDSYVGNASGRLIYAITSSRWLSRLAAAVSRLVPSLRANTFGVGVRFRAHEEWREVFASQGFSVVASVRGPEELVSAARRMLLIKSCRRDSFLLMPAGADRTPTSGVAP